MERENPPSHLEANPVPHAADLLRVDTSAPLGIEAPIVVGARAPHGVSTFTLRFDCLAEFNEQAWVERGSALEAPASMLLETTVGDSGTGFAVQDFSGPRCAGSLGYRVLFLCRFRN